MIVSVVIIASLGIHKVGGLSEVWERAVDGDRIFPPEYVKHGFLIQLVKNHTKMGRKPFLE